MRWGKKLSERQNLDEDLKVRPKVFENMHDLKRTKRISIVTSTNNIYNYIRRYIEEFEK